MGLLFTSFVFDLVALLLTSVLLLVLYAKYTFKFWKNRNIAYLEPSLPFGNTKGIILKNEQIAQVYHGMYNYFKKRNERFGGFFFGLRPELLLIDPDILKQILVKDFDYFADKGTFADENNDPLTAHLFALGSTKWKNLRVKLTPTFTSGKMKMMFPTLVATSREMDNILADTTRIGEPLDIKDLLARFTTDVIGSCAFGIECNCLKTPDTEFRKYGILIFEPQGIDKARSVVGELWPDFLKFFKIRGLNRNLTDFLIGIVRETVKYREDNNIARKDFLHLLLQLRNKGKVSENDTGETFVKSAEGPGDGKTLSFEEMAAQCFVFFAAGFETSSTTMTFSLFELVHNMDIQRKLRNEIITVLKKYNGEITYDAIMEMKYMDQVVNEALRKYPPLAFLQRQCTKDYKLADTNCILKKGQIARVSILGLHHDPEYYPEPEKFDPNRFSEEEKHKIRPYTFMPFGEGPRLCIGSRFGLMQTKVGLTALLRNYEFTLNQKTQLPLSMDPNNMILSPQGGVWLDAHRV